MCPYALVSEVRLLYDFYEEAFCKLEKYRGLKNLLSAVSCCELATLN